jgi:hypothetical protein
LAVYDGYAARGRIGAGVAIKRRQASKIFDFGLASSRGVQAGVVEIGPGDGYIAELSKAGGLEYVGIEGSAAVAEKLQLLGHEVLRGYVPPLPVGLTNGYRCCFMLHVLEHMKTPVEAATVVAQIFERLAPGGALVVACPDYSRWGAHFFDCDYTHSYPLTRRRLSQLLRDQGFEVVESTIYVGPVFGYAGLPISWLAKLLYWPVLDDLLGPRLFKDAMNRGFLTFLPNLLTVARRPLS